MSGQKLDTEETCKQKPNKQREPLQKRQVQQLKIPVVNTDYTGRGLEILRSVSWNKELSETELNPHCPHSSREIPRYIFTIIIFLIKKFFSSSFLISLLLL